MSKINPPKIKLIIGLGNPGEEYVNTRHNIGFIFIDSLAGFLKAPVFEFDKKSNAEISKAGRNLILAKPRTFMNKSGQAAAALARFYKIKPENILVVHDDIDILWGAFKISFGKSSAGHKGVESIIRNLKTKDFWRLRIGIQPTIKKHTEANRMIMKKFTPAETKMLRETIKKAISQLETAF
jgi:PTH1 family peptidyl-tRNA hydrolase